ncbi:MAG: hypothetical protein MZW92_78365 [Comamonadaceae bacterium]|nr:hypothetical protein [Comamonadaceae bacterium]
MNKPLLVALAVALHHFRRARMVAGRRGRPRARRAGPAVRAERGAGEVPARRRRRRQGQRPRPCPRDRRRR